LIVSEFITTASSGRAPVGAGIVVAEHAEPLPLGHEDRDVRGRAARLQAQRVAAEVQDLAAVRPARNVEFGAPRRRRIGRVSRARRLQAEVRAHAGSTG
jgi:hypothetical protein